MFRSILSFTFLFLGVFTSVAQYSDSTEGQFDKAIQLTHDKLYQLAIPIWEKLHQKHPDHAGINFYTGLAFFNSQKRKLKAIPYLKRASDSVSLDHDPFLKERSAPVDLYYYLGRSYHLAYRLKEALAAYRKFRDKAPAPLKQRFEIERHISNVKTAQEMLDQPVPVKVENLGPKVNSSSLDHSPVPSSDGEALFFTSRRLRADSSNYKDREWGTGQRFEQIYVAPMGQDGQWEKAEPLQLFQEYNAPPTAINKAMRSGSSTFNHTATSMITSEDGDLVVYRSSGDKGSLYKAKAASDSSKAKLDQDGWERPEKVQEAISSSSFENHLSISGNKQYLFFVSTREGGYGGKDIYGMRKLPNGEWSDVFNLGPRINTPYHEDGPVVHPNDEVLYFSSEGHRSMGGFDIFAAKIRSDGSLGEPSNIGYPINTPDDDVYFMPSGDAKYGYYSADYKNLKRNVSAVPGFGHEDLYRISFPGRTEEPTAFLQGWVDATAPCYKGKNIDLYAIGPKGDTLQHLRPDVGEAAYRFHLPAGADHELHYYFDGKKVRSEHLQLPKRVAYSRTERTIPLDTIRLVGKEAEDCKLKGPSFDPLSDLQKAKRSKRGAIGLYEVTTGFRDREKEASEKRRDTVRVVKRDTVRLSKDSSQISKGNAMPFRGAGTLLYEAHFGYNKTEAPQQEDDWKTLIDTVTARIKRGEKAVLRIQGSASKVPTSSYSSNLILAGYRSESLRNSLLKAVEEKGLPSQDLIIKDIGVRVQGPEYQGDASNAERYSPYQYVKVYIKGG